MCALPQAAWVFFWGDNERASAGCYDGERLPPQLSCWLQYGTRESFLILAKPLVFVCKNYDLHAVLWWDLPFFTCEALGTRGISLLAANDKVNPCNYTASKKWAQDTVWCFKGLHNWKLRWFCLTVPKNQSSDFQCSLTQISNSVFV